MQGLRIVLFFSKIWTDTATYISFYCFLYIPEYNYLVKCFSLRAGKEITYFCTISDFPLSHCCLREWYNTRLVRLPHIQDELCD